MAQDNQIVDAPLVAEDGSLPIDPEWELPPSDAGDDAAPVVPIEEVATEESEAPEATESLETNIEFDVPEILREPSSEQPVIPPEVQAELTRLRNQEAETLRIQQQNQQTAELQTLERQYMERDGLDAETARYVANQVRAERQQNEAKIAQMEANTRLAEAKQSAALEVGRQFKVNPRALMNMDSRAAMIDHAKLIQFIGQNAKQANERITAVERARVPQQDFVDGNQGAPAFTSQNIDALYLAYEEAHPGQTNPYEARYRAFLEKNS